MITVYVVQALSRITHDFELLGIFDTRDRAKAFIDQAPLPQRECLRVGEWHVNELPRDPFWLHGYDPEHDPSGASTPST